MAHAHSLVHDG
jgi:hypothetical protein